jgi:DivIVA domain-containing protein
VALDRQSIEKKDFPIGRRGYDPEAVDAHLHTLADEIDELKRSARRRTESLAAAASEQVRSIVEAAETSEASSEADATREHATSEAREYVGRVSESTSGMLERIDAMENELNALIESLRTGSNRLNADLQLLEGNLTTVKNAVVPRPQFEPEQPVARRPEPEPAPASEPLEEKAEITGAAAGDVRSDLPAEPAPPAHMNGGDDDGARLIALNMALNGTPRAETDRYLAENFKLTDRRGLLDEVYSSVDG